MKRCKGCGASFNVTTAVASGHCPTCGATIKIDDDAGMTLARKAEYALVGVVMLVALSVFLWQIVVYFG